MLRTGASSVLAGIAVQKSSWQYYYIIKEAHRLKNKRIGIFAGTFNPIHSGHIIFALQAAQAANLDQVYFLLERRPRDKQHVEHYAHRLAMIKQALKPHPEFKILEFVDVNFSVDRTLPKIRTLFPGDSLVMLIGSDIVNKLSNWPNIERLMDSAEFVIGLRGKDTKTKVKTLVAKWKNPPSNVYLLTSGAASVSSTNVRRAIGKRQPGPGLLTSVEKYSNKHWLYISLALDKA